jgi:membrane protease YdiL (CAAX protease family)
VCLCFLAPLLISYEAGVFWAGEAGQAQIRNGADVWMRTVLARVGLDSPMLLPALIAAALLGWHVVARHPWRISGDALAGMLAESVLFAFALVVLGQLQDLAFQQMQGAPPASIGSGLAARAVTYVGAGIYEEALFRLTLLPACYGLFRLLRASPRWAAALALISTSLLFALAHHIGPAGEPVELFAFTFRVLAGLFFAGLFVLRGLGITVGAHAGYDLLVGLLLAARAAG